MIEKTRRLSLVEQVAEQIEQLIESGHFQVGDKIPPEMMLMKQFDVSRNTLREAIRALVHAGLLETRQGSGTMVKAKSTLGVTLEKHLKKATLLEVVDVRLALEKQAAKLAAKNRTKEELHTIKALLDQANKAAKNKQLDVFITADVAFHEAIVRASKNQLLIDLYQPLTKVMSNFIAQMITLEEKFLHDTSLHIRLYESIEKQIAQTAGEYVQASMEELREYVEEMMEE